MQEKFDERWQALLVPKLAEEDMHMRTDEAAVRRQRLDKAQVHFQLLLLLHCQCIICALLCDDTAVCSVNKLVQLQHIVY